MPVYRTLRVVVSQQVNATIEAVLIDPLCTDGAMQMAIDQAMLVSTTDDGIARLRFYTWAAPTLSLGYFQDYDAFFAEYGQLESLAVVRRLTGGGAIIHDQEITYCLTMPSDHRLYRAGPAAGYRAVHKAVIELAGEYGAQLMFGKPTAGTNSLTRGPAFCFARNYPTDLRGPLGKVVGSAQRRLPQAMLQHGSIIMANRFDDQPASGLQSLADRELNQAELRRRLAELLAERLGFQWQRRALSRTLWTRARDFKATVHGTERWVRLGRNSGVAPLGRRRSV